MFRPRRHSVAPRAIALHIHDPDGHAAFRQRRRQAFRVIRKPRKRVLAWAVDRTLTVALLGPSGPTAVKST